MKKNIVLVTVDCWRGDYLGKLEQTKVKTPHLDRLANESNLFSNAQTCGGWTKPAMTALFSSTYASMYGFSQGKLSDQRPMLAEILQKNGYETAGFSTNLVCGSHAGFDRGFNHFKDLRADLTPKGAERLSNLRGFTRLGCMTPFHSISSLFGIRIMPAYPSTTADELVNHALEWLAKPHAKPYFLWLHFMDIHWPYRSSQRDRSPEELTEVWQDRHLFTKNIRQKRGRYGPDRKRSQRWKQLYAEEMNTTDKALGRLFNYLRQREDWSNTAVLATSDHGEEFQEHGTWGHSWNQLHREGIHVPLIIRLPQLKSANPIEQVVSHIDVAPTLLDIANVPTDKKMIGQSLLSLIDKCRDFENRPVYTEMLGHATSYLYRLAIQENGYKYIYDGDQGNHELYNLQDDPQETQNLYSLMPDVARHFNVLRLAHISKGVVAALKNNTPLSVEEINYDLNEDPDVINRLRALGYLD